MSDDEGLPSTILLYVTEDGKNRLQVRHAAGDLWLTQTQLAALFETTPQNIVQHLADIYDDGELDEETTCRLLRVERQEGARLVARTLQHYGLRAILAVGFRVRSARGTAFRQWALERLDEFLVKGFTMDDERLKNPPGPGQVDYFDELLARIRDIRASERRFYQKILDIYATSVDYRDDDERTERFFATVQNKLHWAAHGHTAAEVIYERANADAPQMGLTTTRTAGVVRSDDVTVAKNYLRDDELEVLNRLVGMYIDFAELRAMERRPMTMQDWIVKLDEFLRVTGRELLDHAGSISKATADARAREELARYRRAEDARPRAIDAAFEQAARQLERPRRRSRAKKPKADDGEKC